MAPNDHLNGLLWLTRANFGQFQSFLAVQKSENEICQIFKTKKIILVLMTVGFWVANIYVNK